MTPDDEALAETLVYDFMAAVAERANESKDGSIRSDVVLIAGTTFLSTFVEGLCHNDAGARRDAMQFIEALFRDRWVN